jgi:hypothetical protein
MVAERGALRIGASHRRKLAELARQRQSSEIATVEQLIDEAYEVTLRAARVQAAEALSRLHVEDVPDADTLSQQLVGHAANGWG